MRLEISQAVSIAEDEVSCSAIRAQGAGGQNVNKVSSAVHLRFDIKASSLPEVYQQRLLNYRDRRINSDGVIVIKAQRFRTQDKNRDDAFARLLELIRAAVHVQPVRKATKPTKGSQRRRVDSKVKRGQIKSMRGRVSGD